jgi:hypothetical protein
MITFKTINEILDRTHAAYLSLPTSFRLKGADRDLNNHEKTIFSGFEAIVLTLRSINPDLVNAELFAKLMKDSELQHRDYDSVFGG